MSYFLGKGTAGIQDPTVRKSLLDNLANGPSLFGGQNKTAAPVARETSGAAPGQPRDPWETTCNSGYVKSAGQPCKADFVIKKNPENGMLYCCYDPRDNPDPTVCVQGKTCTGTADCAGKPCDPQNGCQCADKPECVQDTPCKTAYECVGKPCIGPTATEMGKCDCAGEKRTCVPQARCVDSDGVLHDNVCGTGKCTTEGCVCTGPEKTCKQGEGCDPEITGSCGKGTCNSETSKCECCVKGTACTTANAATTCPGGTCKDGACDCVPPEGEGCEECSSTAGLAACTAKGGACVDTTDPVTKKTQKCCKGLGGMPGECTGDKDCPPGYHCSTEPGGVDKKSGLQISPKRMCVKDTGPCPEGVGSKAYAGCPCAKAYGTMTGKCTEGYVFVPRSGTGWHEWKKGAVGRCECVKYCQENGFGDDCQGGGTVGEYQYPAEMDALMKLFMARANALMQMKGGYSEAEINKMFGKGFENIRGQQGATREATEEMLSRQGMLGTGTGMGLMTAIPREGEANIANLQRDIFLANQGQKRQDLKDYTGLAQGLMGTGMNYQQLLEAINAARRGEKNQALMLLLQLLGLYKG